MNSRLLFLAILAPIAACAQTPGAASAAATITARDIERRINIIAHDSMRGRNTPSPELEKVATYVAGEFGRFGLRPGAGDGTFLQRYPIRRLRLDAANSSVAIAGGPAWRFGTDAAFIRFGSFAPAGATGSVLLIAGSLADPRALDASPVAGSVCILLAPVTTAGGLDDAIGPALTALLARGPAAVVMLADVSSSGWDRLIAAQREVQLDLRPVGAQGAPIIVMRDRTIAAVLRARGIDLAVLRRDANRPLAATPVPELRMTVTARPDVVAEASAPNVVGILDGSDPSLRNEYVVYSAHMDHVGIGPPDATGDSVYNGADDDASGTTAVVELAEAFAALNPRPRRSMIFLLVSGEEKDLWGSDFFTSYPPVPVDRMVADLNIDMVGRNWKDTIVAIGREHSDLGLTLDRVADAHPELRMRPIDDLWPAERFYYRSDHYNFARRGVPVLFFFNGTHPDYHRPSDSPDKIDAEKTSRVARLVFYLGLEIGNRTERPKWNESSYREIVGR